MLIKNIGIPKIAWKSYFHFGIPSFDINKDYYKILNVKTTDNPSEIKK